MGRSGDGPSDLGLYESLAGFRFALRRFLAFSEAATRAAGVTAWQYQAMLAIKTHPNGAIVIRELADQMLSQHHGAVQLVDRLCKAGLARRTYSVKDRRTVLVVLTAKGARLLGRLASAHKNELMRYETLLAESLTRLRNIER
ncbi:MAG TPA: MarR family transcriptional regulator [Acetobacteraceae bacterium]|jgi:DNA-binding MarR family transcriptional regulator|nr:MarR family transcriptional regulator [Acetobacteraceae bacterium]